MPFAGGHFESWQAQAGNVKLLYSCHLRVSNEQGKIAQVPQTGDASHMEGQLHDFSSSVSPPSPDKTAATVKPCAHQLLLQLEYCWT